MDFYDKTIDYVEKYTSSDIKSGLSAGNLNNSVKRYGYNALSKKKNKSLGKRILDSLKEPMLLILIFSFCVAFGTSLGSFIKTKNADFTECIGIFLAISLSVFITLFMEGSSQKAFLELNKIYDNITVRVIRDGQILVINQKYVAVGDIVLLSSGDKIVADGRLIEGYSLSVDESTLTGESHNTSKNPDVVLNTGTPLAERVNCVYSGTFVMSGSGKMIVTSIGDNTEIGHIARELKKEKEELQPLQMKLAKLGKIIAIIGFVCAFIVFVLSVVKLIINGNFTFNNVQEIFISCIVLIVAAVPEGLPTIVAISLALNMIKLARENALIKKMIATETAGAVSVICTDKTGTLTENKMTVENVCTSEFCSNKATLARHLLDNFVCNNTADVAFKGNKKIYNGSGTESALLKYVIQNYAEMNIKRYREERQTVYREPFSSETKQMITVIKTENGYRVLIKGAPEKIVGKTSLTIIQKNKILSKIEQFQNKARRVICFAHVDVDSFEYLDSKTEYVYDGFVALYDPLRKEVKGAIRDCINAGIKVKILTGDNVTTAKSIARELNLIENDSQVINATELEKLDDVSFVKAIQKIKVIARSTPIIKLRVVRALKELGEIVAVTGDGINDAPAIKHADVGIAMGVSGSEITKEAGDIILLDDSFMTVVKAISFGRNVFKNIQRFITFQLSVNVSALLLVVICAVLGLPSPFNTLQLLWINVIMDGPPALTLGLEKCSNSLMNAKPTGKNENILTVKMLIKVLLNGIYVSLIIFLQYNFNFLKASITETRSIIFTVFILFQLFNAFNCRELGANSIFKNLGKNKIMICTFFCVFIVHFLIVQFGYKLLGIAPMSMILWLKCILLSSSIILISEVYKLFYRFMRGGSDKIGQQRFVKNAV